VQPSSRSGATARLPLCVRDWEHTATTDPTTISAWWRARPYNMGIASSSQLLVVDLDMGHGQVPPPRSAGARGGEDVLRVLACGAGRPYPDHTFTVSTPSGGRHLYFRMPPAPGCATPPAGSAGLDTRSHGGFVVGAGSVSRVVGRPALPELHERVTGGDMTDRTRVPVLPVLETQARTSVGRLPVALLPGSRSVAVTVDGSSAACRTRFVRRDLWLGTTAGSERGSGLRGTAENSRERRRPLLLHPYRRCRGSGRSEPSS
jgi:hypothetical protein